ncbi:MAG: hypothetical protein GF383_08765, partial [Candidatus Lokiarchaeota archaeon]|nr:hypothetical protein [Candidatus Lokiarchaeota archaeon]MBD3340471.1 hypothetical protein [Candidatus Lokiarchaeota archaeon]
MSKINLSKIILFITIIGFTLSVLSDVNYSNLHNNHLYRDKIDLNQKVENNIDSKRLKTSAIANNWTIMVYVAADNNLESAGIEDLNEMESVQLPEGVELVTLFDRALGYTAVDGDWTTTRRYNITYDEDKDHINSEYQDLGELNMADPETLES